MRTPLYCLLCIILLVACASIATPDGGAYDEEPPKVVSSTPANQATNANQKRINILFDEYIKIENASEKVIVSPPQTEMPNVRADGKRVRIDLYDSLRANTTYTIDFSDAIVDNNEGNPMGNYTFSFSTGEQIDTMEVSGYLLDASNLEPIKGVLVGLYAETTDSTGEPVGVPDSILRHRPFDRVSRTNGSGRFVIKGVAEGKRYRAFALKDMDGDLVFSQKSELVAFDSMLFTPSCRPDIRLDTIWSDSTHYDSIRPIHYTHFFPDDIVLRAFLEDGQDRYLLKHQRETPERMTFFFTAPSDSMPRIQGLSFEGDGGFIPEASEKGDTITYWIPDTTIAYQDTLSFIFTFQASDTLHQLQWTTDTLNITPKKTHAKLQAELQKQIDEWEKEYAKKQKRNRNLPPQENPHLNKYLTCECRPSGSIAPNQNPVFTFSEPILSPPDSSVLHFQIKQDTLWFDEPFEFVPLPGRPRSFELLADWEVNTQYRLLIDSAGIQGALGHYNKSIKQDIRIRREEEFGTLFINIIAPDTGVVVQLLNNSDKPVATQRADANGHADFYYLRPNNYYVRCFIDRNGDGVWSTGEFDSALQPEETFYFPQPLVVKAQWEVKQDWDIRGIPFMRQKPMKITKQKPDKEKKVKNRNQERSKTMKRESLKRQNRQ